MTIARQFAIFRRLFRKRQHDIAFEPVPGAVIGDIKNTSVFGEDDSRQQFQISSPRGVYRLPGGWYRLRMQVHVQAGALQNPCLYPMYDGPGNAGVAPIPLQMQDGQVDEIIMLPYPVVQLRFDPGTVSGELEIRNAGIFRLSRMTALLHLIAKIRSAKGLGVAALTAMMRRFAATSLKYGLRKGAGELYHQYKMVRIQETPDCNYAHWISLYDNTATLEESKVMNGDSLISILLPVCNTPLNWLRCCIDSVLAQDFPKWELCIVGDISAGADVRTLICDYVARDSRIRTVARDKNNGVVAIQAALAMAAGEFVLLLDGGNMLRPNLLQKVIAVLRKQPEVDFIYADEDHMDEMGNRLDPHFKPDWNLDLLLSTNYIGKMAVIRKSIVLNAGGICTHYAGNYQHDLFLRCSTKLNAASVFHIPEILYHQRLDGEKKVSSRTDDSGVSVIDSHLSSICPGAKVISSIDGCYRIKWPLPAHSPKVTLIIPTRDRIDLLKVCVESILEKTDYSNYEILIVDNQSKCDATLKFFSRLRKNVNVRIISFDAPFNYSAINNYAITQTDADVVGLLNNDIEVINSGWLSEMVSHAIRPGIGAVGAMLYYPDDTIQHAGVVLGLGIGAVAGHIYHDFPRGAPGYAQRGLLTQNFSAVTAACLVIKRERYMECGGLDEINLTVAFNDVDFCLRLLEAGYRNVWTPFSELYHHESASRGLDDDPEKQARFMREIEYMRQRWGSILDDDPAYNPNLTLVSQDFALAFPPRTRRCSEARGLLGN